MDVDVTGPRPDENSTQRIAERLQQQQQFIRYFVNLLPHPLYLTSAEDTLAFTNEAYDALLPQGQPWPIGVAGGRAQTEASRLQALSQQVRAGRQAVAGEWLCTLATGETRYFQVHKRPVRRADGNCNMLTVCTDVTLLRLAQQEVERRAKQYRDLVHYSQALICTHDRDGYLLSVNPAIERLTGQPAHHLVGQHLGEVLVPAHRAALQAYLRDDETALPQPRAVAIRTATGELRYLQCYTYRVCEEVHPPYVVASGYDMTAGYLAQRALRRAKQQAEDNTRAKEAFLARMSHEIRTPLNGVLGMAALLQKTDLTAVQQEYLRTMQLAGRHLLALVNDVLDMAKITAHPLELEYAPFDLALVLQGAGQTVAALAAQKGLHVTVAPLAAAAVRVVGDAYRLHQVLLNLLGNAIKFTEQGWVRLGTDVLHDTPTELVLRFWVQDTGIGIPPEKQAHIFDAFAQASAETSRRYGGTGLGLAISQQLVEQMGGVLRLSSTPGEGSTFAFQLVLPRAQETPAAPASATDRSCFERLRGLRVLLAEDNLVNQQIAVAVLQNWGVDVTTESNGLDALSQLQQQAFDVALLDIRMPGLNGLEVAVALRQFPEVARARTPLVALTANAFQADRDAYLAAGIDACLTKPYEEAALGQLLVRLTGRT
jgi:PAS domain S-box-containing protein